MRRQPRPVVRPVALLALDFDETVFSTVTALRRVGHCPELPDSRWESICAHFGEQRGLELLDLSCETEDADLFPGASEALRELQAQGLLISLITARHEGAARSAARLLATRGVAITEIFWRQDEKVELARSLGADVLADDCPRVLAAAQQAGIAACALRQDHNADALQGLDVACADGWSELGMIIGELASLSTLRAAA